MKKIFRNIIGSNANGDSPSPIDNRILYTVVEGGVQPTSTWIIENCTENVFDENTGEGYLILNEGVDTVEGENGRPKKNIFNDDGTDSNVESVVLPSQITSIGEYAFYRCLSLTSITIPNSVTSVGEGAFDGCSGLTSVTIPNSVTSVGEDAFDGCSGLTSVTIPNSVTSVSAYVFGDCTGLTSVTIPNSVTNIYEGAFSGCTSLTSVTIPDSITNIGDRVFLDCTGLISVTCLATTPPTLGANAFANINTTTCGVPKASIPAYGEDASWSAVFTTFTEVNALASTEEK